jgi:tRNA A-37 threonylcarbamoyl transferase component Bud32
MRDATQPVTPPSLGTTPPPPPPSGEDLSGKTLGDFQILRRLGQGGMGEVYLAEQLSLKRKVALKFLRPDLAAKPTALLRFRAEAEAVARVTHANIVQVYAIGEADGRHYMALEYVEGRNLRDYLSRKGPPELPAVLSVMRQVAAALQRAGESGIVHRDIKPENILLTRKGEVKVADFGLSRVFGTEQDLNLTQTGMTLGTPMYMSPEQVQGRALDPRADIYSFGVTCYHMLAGQPPFRGQNAFEVALKHVNDAPPPLAELRPDLPPGLCALVHRMMSKDPAERPQTGREILRELSQPRAPVADNPFAGLTATAPPAEAPTVAEPLRPAARWRRMLLRAGLSVVIGLALGIGLRLVVRGRTLPPAPADDYPNLPVVSERERQLRSAVELYAAPKGEKVRPGAGFHVELGVLYLEQKRYDEAEAFFEAMAKRPGVPAVYKTISHFGLAVTYAMQDKFDESVRAFQSAKGVGEMKTGVGGFRAVLPPISLPPEELINLRYWVLTALERDATHAALPKELEEMRKDLRRPRLNPGSGNRAGDKSS